MLRVRDVSITCVRTGCRIALSVIFLAHVHTHAFTRSPTLPMVLGNKQQSSTNRAAVQEQCKRIQAAVKQQCTAGCAAHEQTQQ